MLAVQQLLKITRSVLYKLSASRIKWEDGNGDTAKSKVQCGGRGEREQMHFNDVQKNCRYRSPSTADFFFARSIVDSLALWFQDDNARTPQ